jgi:siroheme synthase
LAVLVFLFAPKTGTVVLYMGLSTLRVNAERLVAMGRAPSTPVAVVAHATLPTERVVVADLATIADAVDEAKLPTPALVIVGEVVARRVTLAKHEPQVGDDARHRDPRIRLRHG